MRPTTVALVALGALVIASGTAASGCSCDTFRFYEVTRTPTDECDILPSGEFCVEAEQLSAPTFEIWTVEHRGEEVRIIVDEEVWIADAADAELPDRISSAKREVATVEPGPCTTTTERAFDLVATFEQLTGTLSGNTRLTGPEDCGETPRGLRSIADLLGPVAGAP